MKRLDGRVALVTGAGGPMGRAVALKLAREGARLVLTDISGNRLAGTERDVAEAVPDGGLVAVRANVMNRQEAAQVAARGVEAFGRIDVLINVVGGIRSPRLYTPFLELDEAQWDDTLALNLKPGFHLIRIVAPGMLACGWGRIVNVASVVFAGEAGQADYAAAKAAVASLTRTLSMEFAPHVNVNCIAPGMIQTSVFERLADEDRRRFLAKCLLNRPGLPEEIADAVAFLSSDESSFVTGEILAVSGGNHPSL
ncbi:MAG TPA: SDR family oxidoreductase [Rubrivivax sp.]|nr:SDR family oxidoreductase [Rubrivivax sp.]